MSRTISPPGSAARDRSAGPTGRESASRWSPSRNPPPVQMLVPGFSVRELPVNLTNINNIKYRADGKLVALAYDGDIYLLSDRDGDGLEEQGRTVLGEQGEPRRADRHGACTPPGYHLGEGVFVASKGKVSLIVDVDRDGKADREVVVASGWKELPHGVDALGVALDRDGNVYFGLGTTDFTNAYRVDAAGRAAYDLKDEHGTIQKVSPDFSRREIIATGIRFPVGAGLQPPRRPVRHRPGGGDLAAQRQPVRRAAAHPARAALRLPAPAPEAPPVGDRRAERVRLQAAAPVDLRPELQRAGQRRPDLRAACVGRRRPRHRLFAGQALPHQAGEDPGRLRRPESDLLAVLNRLAADACVSPQRRLVVAVHSGLPDWGSGPKGKGKLYKIAYSDRDAPQPVLAWASAPQEVRIAFDRPLDPARLRDLAGKTLDRVRPDVRPGDRFESLRPGYEVVGRQLATPRFDAADPLDPGLGRPAFADPGDRPASGGVLLRPHPARAWPARPATAGAGELPQVATVDLGYDLSGVEAAWRPETEDGGWSGWLPHLDLAVARAFTAGSADHDRLWQAMERPGRLMLRTKLDLWQMLRPAVQPGSTTGYTLPDEEVTLIFSDRGPIEVTMPAGNSPSVAGADGRYRVQVTVTPRSVSRYLFAISMATDGRPTLEVSWSTREDARPRALPLRRFLLPWAPLEKRAETIADRDIPELKGGDWVRGRALFYGEPAKCASCHKVRGRGGEIGPDLSNLVHRDYASVFRDMHAPSAAINPDYISHSIALADGRVLVGTLRTDGGRLIVGDSNGRTDSRRSLGGRRDVSLVGLDHARGPRHGARAGKAARPADVPADRSAAARRRSSTTARRRLVAGRNSTRC